MTTSRNPRKPTSQIREQVGDFERILYTTPGYNDRGGPYGVDGLRLRFVLVGELGATAFLMSTGWAPGEKMSPALADLYPSGWDRGFHWRSQLYDYLSPGTCDVLEEGTCYYDGSGLAAEPLLQRFIVEGMAGVWDDLESYYRELANEVQA